MEQVIYGDVLFIINFSMDFLTLYITAKIMHAAQRPLPSVLAAAVGALYAVAGVFYTGNAALGFILNIVVSLIMCYMVFGKGGFSFYLRSLLLFFAVSFALGGTMTALFNLINRKRGQIYINGGVTELYSDVPLLWIIIAAVLSGAVVFIAGRLAKRKTSEKTTAVKAEFEGREIVLDSICDSGNLLREPASGRPVIITSYSSLKPLLPPELHYVFKNKNTSSLGNINLKYMKRVRLIPVTTVGHSGILLGFLPDKVTVGGVEREACMAVDDSVGSVGASKIYGGCAAVVPAVLLK